MSDLPFEIKRAPKHVQDHYLQVLAMGYGERWALMAALQQPPGTKGTDRTFMHGRLNGEWLGELPEKQAKYILREAKAAGIDVVGKVYCSGLADKRGWCDPAAWVDSVSDIQKVAQARNMNVQGMVNVKAREVEAKRVDLNPKIVARLAKDAMAKDPKLTKGEAVALVKEKHTPRWKRPK